MEEQAKIRKVEAKDIEKVSSFIFNFYEEGFVDYNFIFSKENLNTIILNVILNQIGFVAVKAKKIIGVIGGILTPSMFNPGQIIGQEIVWYVSKSERKGLIGIRLIIGFEKECRDRGASFVAMARIGDLYAKELNKFYIKRGYKLLETQYIKTL